MTFAVAESEIDVLLVEPTGEGAPGLGEQLAEANESLTIHSVTDVGRARAVLRDTVIDCAVCVHDPPSIDGLEVLSAIRERTPELPVLLAVDTERSARSVLDTGATDVVSLIDGRIDRDVVTNRIENAVAGSRDRDKFEQVFEQATDGIAIHDPRTGAVLESNARLAELLGYDPDDPAPVGIEDFAAGAFPAHLLMISNLYGDHEVGGQRVSKGTVINFFVNRALAGEPITVYEPGTQSRNYVHVDDVARVYVHSAERLLDRRERGATGVETFAVASEEDPSVTTVAERVRTIAREEAGLDPEVRLVENPRGNETLVEEFAVDTSRTREVLGWEPRHGVEETIRALIRRKATDGA